MNTFSVMHFILGLGGLFLLVLIVMLIHPKWRKGLFRPYPESTRHHKLGNLADGLELIFTPIMWIIKIIVGIFKS